MAIPDKDQKLLWSRAAGHCSMADCRAVLTLDTTCAGAATVGAMCHIVGEKRTSPRGDSLLTLDERNSYANLILLCSHHHDIIDRDVGAYPIERLHQIKTEHELWVAERLAGPAIDVDELVYADVVDTVVASLQLEHWATFIDSAVRDLIHEDSFEARGILNAKRLSVLWPGKYPAFETATQELIDSYSDFITHFETHSEFRLGGFFAADLSYKRFLNPRYQEDAAKHDAWSKRNFWFLCDFVIKLNRFAEEVRSSLNPMFFKLEGKFIIIDSLGYRFDGNTTLYDPTTREIGGQITQARLEAGAGGDRPVIGPPSRAPQDVE